MRYNVHLSNYSDIKTYILSKILNSNFMYRKSLIRKNS